MRLLKKIILYTLSTALLYISTPATAWENGGRTKNLQEPKYGTHDWIAEQARDILPESKIKDLLKEYSTMYLLGTEAPDNKNIAVQILGEEESRSYGDQFWHNNYYDDNGELLEGRDHASRRAQEEYNKALNAYLRGDKALASFYLGALTHFSDVAAWPHVMGEASIHETQEEISKHSEFERSVDQTITLDTTTQVHTSTIFQKFIKPLPPELETITAYEAITTIGRETHFGIHYTPTRMQQYLPMGRRQNGSWVDCSNWNPTYIAETGEALNRAVHYIALILYTFDKETQKTTELQNQ